MADLLWGIRAEGSRGPKPMLTLDRIADAAIGIADAEGLTAVSMQRVSAELGFTKMALYRYLPGKKELVAVIVERALGEPPDLQDMTWRAGLRAWAHALLAAHLRHPWTLEAVMLPRPVGPNELSWMEAALALLVDTGLTGAERLDIFAVLTGQVRVIAHQARATSRSEDHFLTAIGDVLTKHADRFPALARTVAEATMSAAGQNQAFDFGLERILDGLQALIEGRGDSVRTGLGDVP
ncbi:TetR/AcrR family transcriptional regulator C-terminal domain-containing protein [Nonomuraea sp. NPDC048916]|uniref:TetR/AcrR family transcriptional regulator n=1 Tax=Nonomuraea sp. NPDC048916 TaxID=3154232 RepID=UPI0033C62136